MYRHTLLAAFLAVTLAGCANTPRSCDGSDRRPLNQATQAEVTHPACGSRAIG